MDESTTAAVPTNPWAYAGAILLMVIPFGHLFIVDISINFLLGTMVTLSPDAAALDAMRATTADWGWVGRTTLYRGFSGFSLWLVFSFLFLGGYTLLVLRHTQVGDLLRRRALQLCLVLCVVFTNLAVACFILAPVFAGSLGVVFFALALRREPR